MPMTKPLVEWIFRMWMPFRRATIRYDWDRKRTKKGGSVLEEGAIKIPTNNSQINKLNKLILLTIQFPILHTSMPSHLQNWLKSFSNNDSDYPLRMHIFFFYNSHIKHTPHSQSLNDFSRIIFGKIAAERVFKMPKIHEA